MGPDGDGDKQVPGGAAVLPGVALAPDGNGLAVVDARGYAGLNGLALADRARAPAFPAGLVDNLPLAAAAGAGGRGGEDPHGRLPPDLDRSGAMAVRADLRGGPLSAAAALAAGAGLQPLHGDGLLTAEGRLLKAEDQGQADALSPLGGVGVAPPPAAEAAAEEAAENIPQVAEVEAPVEAAAPRAEIGVHAGVAELVVPAPLLPVRENFVSLVGLLKLFLGLLVVRVQVRVVLPGQLFIRLFDFVVRRALRHAQDFIIITFLFRHSSSQGPLSSVSALRRKLRPLPCSSSPSRTRCAGLRAG